jgi:potassium-dependent mechanosensitive channel
MFMIYHRLIFPLFFYLLLCFFIPPHALAQQNSTDVNTKKSSIEEFKQSLEKAINNEKEKLDDLKNQLSRIEESQNKVKEELTGYTIQISAHNNLFLLPDTSIQDLEEARLVNHSAAASVSDKIKSFEQRASKVDEQILRATEQSLVNENQLKEFREQKPLSESSQSVIRDLQELNKLFSSKKATLDKIQQIHRNNIQEFKLTRKALSDLAEKFENQIQIRKKEELFKRTSDALFGVGIKPLVEEFFQIDKQIRSIFSRTFWETELSVFWRSSDFYTFSSLLLFLLLIILIFRMGRHLDRFLKDPKMEPFPWASLTLRILRRSLLLLGFVLFFYLYSAILAINSRTSLFHLSLTLLFIWLFTKWPIDLLRLWNNDNRPNLPFAVHFRIRLLIVFIRYFAMAYVSIQWLISSSSIILVLGRFVFEISLLIWTACFWRLLRKKASDFFSIQYKGIRVFHTFTSFILYTVAGVGFLLDLTGFGTLAVYWYTSCAKSAIVFMWSGLIFLSIKEWADKAPSRQKTEDYSEKKPAFPIRWLTLRIAGLFLALLFLFSILLAWGAKQALLLNIYNVLNYPFHVGQMRFSLLNMIYAFLAVVLTHVIVRFWRHILREKLLDNKDLEPGLKDSVTSITVYIAWALGILIALRAFGLSTTSMAVAFGALGIGLGFGLQNIFSNFISGIILLFERPIQVGDAIEINGTWGEVRKINVRSTLVQTYDNASLIIPNADFISSQVTNWSFKDMRLRRTIVVGVAYGSDVNLVKKTLEEIAQKITWVLKFPVPQVLFSDFGDSALIFKLRIWTDIDHMLIVDSEIRFEIYRLFNERGIEIAFPQLDLHVRSVEDKETFLDNRTEERNAVK